MAKLTSKKRIALPKSTFGLPGERKYPMPDASHAANAKARASQQASKGNISKGQKAKIDAKADKVIEGRRGKYATGGRIATPLSPYSMAKDNC